MRMMAGPRSTPLTERPEPTAMPFSIAATNAGRSNRFCHPARNNADNTLTPTFARNRNDRHTFSRLRFRQRYRFINHTRFNFLALAIQAVQRLGKSFRRAEVIRGKQLEPCPAIPLSAHRH